MSVSNLNYLFHPRSLAVIGASDHEDSLGGIVLRNVLASGYGGPVMPVHPEVDQVAGMSAYHDIASMPESPDVAVICTPAPTVPELIAELGERGVKAAIIITAGLGRQCDGGGRTLQEAALDAARSHSLRLLGPNCVGLIVPSIGLNASFAPSGALPGHLALVSQSGAMCTAVMDWAHSKGIGFSHLISLGNCADVDFDDTINYLAEQPDVHAILLYIESVRHARAFMTASRSAARMKPVLAVKAGRVEQGARAAASHTGAIAGADDVYDAAIRRAGMLRLLTIEDLFDAAEMLSRCQPPRGDRLAIVTNGGGPGVMATDTLVTAGGTLAELSEETIAALDKVLPPTWSKANPLDIIGDAPPERYVKTLQCLDTDENIDATLLIHAPSAIAPSHEIARAVIEALPALDHPLLVCWLGGDAVVTARKLFDAADVPSFESPEDAVNAFLRLVQYQRNQHLLQQMPTSRAAKSEPDIDTARNRIDTAIKSGQEMMGEVEAKELLAAYGIPVVQTRIAGSVDEVERLAWQIGFPVAVKIRSPDITHKSDVGGVALNLDTPEEARAAAEAMIRRVRRLFPRAGIDGFSVQKMVHRPGAHELIIGATVDATFGPIVLFGHGGTAVEVIRDRAIGLPPLNMTLARDMIERTRISRLLAGYRDRPPAAIDAICDVLVQTSRLMEDHVQIVELDINPLLADENGVLVLDARVKVQEAECSGAGRLAIEPEP